MKFLLQRVSGFPQTTFVLTGLIVTLALSQTVSAAESVNITDLKDCRNIESKAERLVCYDTITDGGVYNQQKQRQVQADEFGSKKMPKSPEPAPVKSPASATAEVPAATSSTEVTPTSPPPAPGTGSDDTLDRLYVTIVRSKKGPNGLRYFQTAEGQVWMQQNAASWSSEVPFEAEIKKGVMGSFFLVNEGGKSTRVKRVR